MVELHHIIEYVLEICIVARFEELFLQQIG